MTPINLEDVESYLLKRYEEEGYIGKNTRGRKTLITIFAELRAREESKALDSKEAKCR